MERREIKTVSIISSRFFQVPYIFQDRFIITLILISIVNYYQHKFLKKVSFLLLQVVPSQAKQQDQVDLHAVTDTGFSVIIGTRNMFCEMIIPVLSFSNPLIVQISVTFGQRSSMLEHIFFISQQWRCICLQIPKVWFRILVLLVDK